LDLSPAAHLNLTKVDYHRILFTDIIKEWECFARQKALGTDFMEVRSKMQELRDWKNRSKKPEGRR